MKKLRHRVRNIILFILAFIAGLFIMEGFERFAEIESLSNFEVDSVHGKKLRPDVPLLYLNEGFYMGRTNHHGYLGPDYPPGNKSNVCRVALIGDSYVEAFHVFDRNSYRAILENELSRLEKRPVQVMNFGRSGFVLSDMYVYYREYVSEYHPDDILVFVHNDDFFQQSYQSLLPKVLPEENHLTINHDFVYSKAFKNYQETRFFRENSVYLRIMNNCYKLYKDGLTGKILFGKLNGLISHSDKKNKLVKGNKNQKAEQEIPELNEEIIRTFAENRNVYLVLGDRPSKSVEKLIENTGIRTIKLYTVLEKMKSNGIDPNYWVATNKEGHWNASAHQLIGEALAKKLISEN